MCSGRRNRPRFGGKGNSELCQEAICAAARRSCIASPCSGSKWQSRIPLEFWLPLENVRGLWYSCRCPASLPPTLPTFTASQRSWDAGSVARRVVRCGLGWLYEGLWTRQPRERLR